MNDPQTSSLTRADDESKAVITQFEEQMAVAVNKCRLEESRMNQLLQDNRNLLAQVREKTAQRDALKAQTESLAEDIAQLCEKQKDIDQGLAALKANEEENKARLAEENEAEEAAKKAYEAACQEYIEKGTRAIDEMYEILTTYKPDKMEAEKQRLVDELSTLKQEIAAVQAKTEQAKRENARREEEQKLSAENASDIQSCTMQDLEDAYNNRKELVETLERDRAQRLQEKEEILAKREQKREEIAALQAEAEALQREYEDTHFEVVSLRSSLATSYCKQCSGPLLDPNS